MPTGPNGEKRPVDPVACAVAVGRIATGEDEPPVKARRPKRPKAPPAVRQTAARRDTEG